MKQFHYDLKASLVRSHAGLPASKAIVFGFLTLACLVFFPDSARCSWEKSAQPPAAEAPLDLSLCAEKPDCFYAATSHEVFQNNHGEWQKIFSLVSSAEIIARIYTFPSSSGLWVQTGKRIFYVASVSKTSAVVYETNDPEKFPLSFFAEAESLWLGTTSGLWTSKDSGKSWQKQSGLADHKPVSLIVKSPLGLFFSENGNWRIAEENSPQTILKLFDSHDSEESAALLDPEIPAEFSVPSPQNFFDLLETEEAFYLATIKGVFQSQNGFDWESLSGSGLRSAPLRRLAWDLKNKHLVGISEDGFFIFDSAQKTWRGENDGLVKTNLTALLSSPSGAWLVANPGGLWEWSLNKSSAPVPAETARLFNHLTQLEPSARDVQNRVIRYSDTGNGKIKRWHAESRVAALLPNLSAGKDWGTSNNVDLDRAGTSDPDRFINGPWNKDRGADFGLSWNLGDLVFSSSQTSIDSRAKYNVDLRNDLLSEAMRLYFERRRLQAEIIYAPSADEKTHYDRLLRLDELTALLDALTGGWLSEKLEQTYKLHPELETLWRFENKEQGTKNKGENK